MGLLRILINLNTHASYRAVVEGFLELKVFTRDDMENIMVVGDRWYYHGNVND